jgi:uncharacterized membrane protein YfcA
MGYELLIILAIFIVAVLYSSVGHGGASGYLAVMAFLAVPPEITRPTALTLNLFVASIAFIQFYRAGFFKWNLFWPFAVTSVPFAFLGGMIHLPTNVYKILLGFVLLFAAFRLAWHFASDSKEIQPPKLWMALLIGAGIGLLSGLVGVGGRYISYARSAFDALVRYENGSGCFGIIHSCEFRSRIAGKHRPVSRSAI